MDEGAAVERNPRGSLEGQGQHKAHQVVQAVDEEILLKQKLT